MDFTIPTAIEDLRRRIAGFVESEILPHEARPESYDGHGNIGHEPLESLRRKARAAGLWTLQLPRPDGTSIGKVGMAVCYEEMNRSIFGPVVFNSAAPDDGNMMLLEAVATPEQKEIWLKPIADGHVRSAFAMTEPHPGGGSDPSMIRTRAGSGFARRLARRRYSVSIASVCFSRTFVVLRATCPFAPTMSIRIISVTGPPDGRAPEDYVRPGPQCRTRRPQSREGPLQRA